MLFTQVYLIKINFHITKSPSPPKNIYIYIDPSQQGFIKDPVLETFWLQG